MKRDWSFAVAWLSLLVPFVTGCEQGAVAFVQDGIRLVPPVYEQANAQGAVTRQIYNDGGTQVLTLIDSTGKKFRLVVDRRIGNEMHFYLNAYPGEPGSIRITDQATFERLVLKDIRYRQ